MGANMVRRLTQARQQCVVYDVDAKVGSLAGAARGDRDGVTLGVGGRLGAAARHLVDGAGRIGRSRAGSARSTADPR